MCKLEKLKKHLIYIEKKRFSGSRDINYFLKKQYWHMGAAGGGGVQKRVFFYIFTGSFWLSSSYESIRTLR